MIYSTAEGMEPGGKKFATAKSFPWTVTRGQFSPVSRDNVATPTLLPLLKSCHMFCKSSALLQYLADKSIKL